MTDKCTKIVMEFENEVLGPYRWSWDKEMAEKVFAVFGHRLVDIISSKVFQPTITDLRDGKR
jgi:hypothetical protein